MDWNNRLYSNPERGRNDADPENRFGEIDVRGEVQPFRIFDSAGAHMMMPCAVSRQAACSSVFIILK
jgi:hypothetical protein